MRTGYPCPECGNVFTGGLMLSRHKFYDADEWCPASGMPTRELLHRASRDELVAAYLERARVRRRNTKRRRRAKAVA